MDTAVRESHEQFLAAWEHIARAVGNPHVEAGEGVKAVFGRVPLPFFNFVFLVDRCAGPAELDRALEDGLRMGKELGLPWMFCVAHDAVPGELLPAVSARLGEAGMGPMMELTGMIAGELEPAQRTVEGLEYRRVAAPADSRAVSDVNCLAYGLPLEAGHGAMDRAEIFAAPGNAVLGQVNGETVTCSATIPIDGRLYVAFVATAPEWQRRGYAEAVMRRSLAIAAEETGLSRSVLHASDAGRPVYARMGYQTVTGYTLFVGAH